LLLMFGLGHALPVILLSTVLTTTRKLITQRISEKGEWLTMGFGVAFLLIEIVIAWYALESFLL